LLKEIIINKLLMNNSFSSFNESFVGESSEGMYSRVYEQPLLENNISRNFEQLITERGNLYSVQLFDDVFDKIKEKMFSLTDSDRLITHEKINEYSEKWNTVNLNNSIDTFKKDIGDIYQKKTHLEIELGKKKELYKSFCDHITQILDLTEQFYSGSEKQDSFRKILLDRIEWYYYKLDLANLILEYTKLNEEFVFLKKSFMKLSSILNPVICSICYENQVAWYIDPCGHTICDNCKTKCESNTKCHYCSTKRNKYARLYL
jgi:hypothetical protein